MQTNAHRHPICPIINVTNPPVIRDPNPYSISKAPDIVPALSGTKYAAYPSRTLYPSPTAAPQIHP